MFGLTGSMAIVLTESVLYPVLTNVHALVPAPPVVDYHNPPLAEPAQTIFELLGLTARERTRPPTLFGPRETHCDDASADFENSSSLFIEVFAYRAAFWNASCGIKSYGRAR